MAVAVLPGLLGRPSTEVAHLLALRFLDEAASGATRLHDPNDSEALHDFRVGMRRLRSLMRAYGPELRSSVGKKWRRRVRDIASLTNEGRDAEVQVEWLKREFASMRLHKRGARWVLRQIEERMDDAYAEVRSDVLREFGQSEMKLRQRLRLLPNTEESAADEPTFGGRTGALLREQLKTLWDLTTSAHSPDDEREIHDARIAAKQIRYVLEPLQDEIKGGKKLVKTMKRLQDVLGDLHDVQVVEETLRKLRLRASSPVKVAGTVAAIDELSRRAEMQRMELFRNFDSQWHHCEGPRFFETVSALADELQGIEPEPDEYERAFRLSALPAEAKVGRREELLLGWFPGETIREHLEKRVTDTEIRYLRRVELESAGRLTVAREELDEATFKKLFSLTVGRRLKLRCYSIDQWRFECTPREALVIVRCMTPTSTEPPAFPEWLEPLVEGELGVDEQLELSSLAA